jgi:hypothetical protein
MLTSLLKSTRSISFACTMGLGLLSETAWAMDFTSSFFMPVSVNYDSNIQMQENNEESINFYNTTPTLRVTGNDGVNSLSFNGSVLFQRSSDEDISEDRKDPSLGLGWTRGFERGEFTLSTNYNKSSTRVSERRVTGLIFNDGSAITRSYDASLRYLITEKFSLSTGLNYQETTFSGANLDDFNSKNFNSRLNYLYNEKLTPFVQFSISRFENETNSLNSLFTGNANTSGNSVSRNLLVGYAYKMSPQLDYSVALGVNRVSSAGSGWIGNASLNYVINEKSSLIGTISRNVTPTGLGGFLEIDNLGLSYLYDIDQKNHLGSDVNWSITRDVNNSNFKQLGAFYSYDLSEDWDIRTYAQYRSLQAINTDASAYQIGFSFSFNHPNLF